METFERLKLLTSQMHLESAEDSNCPQLSTRKQDKITVSDAVLPNGKRISLLKSQFSTVCERNCYYCPFRAGRDFLRASFKPEEFAKVFMSLYQAHIAEGIFLSSGIVNNGIFTQDKLIDTAHILRTQPQHKGWNGHWPSSVTQFVVSAVDETDLELMATTEYLYNQLQLKRAYYSSFSPIINTPLENVPPGSPVREHRLYEASFLLRDYGFCMEELPFNPNELLPFDVDPKYAWAKQNLLEHPVEINRADKRMLLRIPGIGPKIT